MNWSQSVVVVWGQFALASAFLFGLASLGLRRILQPAERVVVIYGATGAGAALLVLLAAGGLATWRWELIEPVETAVRGESAGASTGPSAGALDERSASTAPSLPGVRPGSTGPGVARDMGASWSPAEVSAQAAAPAGREGRQRAWQVAALTLCSVQTLLIGLFFVRRRRGVRQWRRLWEQASPASPELQRVWAEVTGPNGGRVELRVSGASASPLLRGWFRPQVLASADLAAQGGRALRSCLAHEWAHIVRRDFAGWRFVDVCQLLFWFAPGYWALRRELRTCQDMLADRAATGAAGDAVEYSELLVALARRGGVEVTGGALAWFERRSQLLRRVQLLLDPSVPVAGRSRRGFACAVAVAAMSAVLSVGAVRIDALGASATTAAEDDALQAPQPSTPPVAVRDEAGVKADAGRAATVYRCRVVEQGSERPIAGALVTVRRLLTQAGDQRPVLETRHKTDADGSYELAVSAGHGAEPTLYVELDVEHPDYPPKKGFGYSYAMIRKNEKLGERPFFERTELRVGEPVTGIVLDPQGRPLADLKVGGFSTSTGDWNNASWNDARTDAQGRFRLVMHKDAEAVVWFVPKQHAIEERYLGRRRGELGEVKLTEGVRLRGRVVGVDGRPLAGVPVNLLVQGEREASRLPVLSSVRRGVLSSETGEFALDPLPPGEYQLSVDETLYDPLLDLRKRHSVSAVFVPQRIELKADEAPAEAVLQATPHVTVKAQYYDSAGRKARGHTIFVNGRLDGRHWSAQAHPDASGAVVVRAPRGSTETTLQLMTNEHGALRYRRSGTDELRDDAMLVNLGTLDADVADFQIIRYTAPIVLVSAVDEQGRPVGKLQVKANYTKPRPAQYFVFAGGSDILFERQAGDVYRSSQLLPDEEVTIVAAAEGYEPAGEKVKLAEGTTRELRVTLKKAAPAPPPPGPRRD